MKKKKNKKSVFIPVCFSLIIIGLLYLSLLFFLEINTKPVSKNMEYKTYEITTNSESEICKFLKDKNLIKNKTAFYLKAKLSGISGRFGKGKYELSPSMSAAEIINILQTDGIKEENTVKITITEGYTVEDIANLLYEKNIIYNKEIFLDLCKTGEIFKKNHALSDIDFENIDSESKYVLEGYLFPDTYEFFINSSSDIVITKMLDKFNEVYNASYLAKMKEYGYSKEDVIILASIIEKEGKTNDFKKVSAVLHNRLDKKIPLQVDASVRYIENIENSITINSEQYQLDSKYNTYKNKELPPTAICNPSKNAIEAVLYPDEEFVKNEYLYFCLTDYETGAMVFSKTYQEHLENVKKYKNNWQDYDSAIE